jgi:hypothetical protein
MLKKSVCHSLLDGEVKRRTADIASDTDKDDSGMVGLIRERLRGVAGAIGGNSVQGPAIRSMQSDAGQGCVGIARPHDDLQCLPAWHGKFVVSRLLRSDIDETLIDSGHE